MFGTDATKEWTESLKAGDEVFVTESWGGIRLAKVERVTATQIIVNGTKYRKAGGDEIGSSSRWHRAHIVPASEERKQAVREDIRRKKAEGNFSRLTHQNCRYSIEQLEAVIAILEPKKEQNEQGGTD